ncbi:flagellar biosynthesis anti-sigma factor protein FlgM [Caldalkalibacillus thermarum TA2.A1]|uniref:Negative regulator of flagellin synthesis n=1 Tax=Caldalkalibacillus thermarum (strain TA2.A1) TaxID=986075 RepID=F5L4E9_CALTT|nr:flagellar biosynthesis anti-sigma factor FlgM [Caldalkalibacillus thermarum]EGL83792.1 flagellar biosynthesis anti-sigma factor protein FlgM [Caldalkalibacillus thermarum TA2.A1]QZT33968.1 flagellar biosynthesis anti-sigma factor FlgM [Caldalkalibacillus thermarum TA2.A1]
MKIDHTHGVWRPNPYQQQAAKPVQKREKPGRDQVQISAEAKAMLDTQTALNRKRQAKLERIKSELESGTYQVDSRKVAERLFDFWFRRG